MKQLISCNNQLYIATFSEYHSISIAALLYYYCTYKMWNSQYHWMLFFFYEGKLLVLKPPFTIKFIESSYVAFYEIDY